MEKDKEKQKKYELSFLSQEEGGKEALLKWVARFEGEIVLEGPVEKIALSYPISNQTSADFGFIHFNMIPSDAEALSKELKTAGIFLRFLMITPPSVKTNKPRVSSNRSKPTEESAPVVASERKVASETLSNEDLEKKIEEILQQQ